MAHADLAAEIITDLLRSAWIVEQGRASVYERWGRRDRRFRPSGRRARERAGIVERSLSASNVAADQEMVEPHARWMRSLVGDELPEVAFAEIVLARLGDWVEGHASGFLIDGAERLAELGAEERSTLRLPADMPLPPPFEPLPTSAVEPPGEAKLRFGILADIHIGSATGETMARAAIEDLNASGAEFVVQLGDITEHGDVEEFERASQLLAKLEMPYATMMGNHDVLSVKEERLSGRDYYPRYFGRDPDGVLLEHKGIRFAVLDSIEMGTSPFAPFNFMTGEFAEGPGGAVVRGSLTPPQHDLLAEVASPGGPPAFVFLHHPPQPFTGFPPVVFGLRDEDTGRLHATCDSGNVWGVFAGHTHRNARTRMFDSVPAHEVAAPRDFPFGYALVDVSDGGYAYRFLQVSDEGRLRAAYEQTGEILRRYSRGSEQDRGFVWAARA